MIPADSKSFNHLVVIRDPKEAQLPEKVSEGAKPNVKHGAVTPIRAMTGSGQQFACCVNGLVVDGKKVDLCMTQHAGRLYEGAMHSATDDVQFVNCPYCKETKEYKEALATHERWTKTDQGVFGRVSK